MSDQADQLHLMAEEKATYTIDAESKAAYRERLRQKLQDPAFRQIEGFPLGEDEDILALSDPPYYTACPNPFLAEIVEQWQAERAAVREALRLPDDSDNNRTYQREPFAADVSEGKNDPIYNAHSYHTKVPHKAIMHYILHYTDPGDIILDGFSGTGMVGIAAQLCDEHEVISELGYEVDEGIVYDGDIAISRIGTRKTVLNDLSTAATFIAANYNLPVNVASFAREGKRILSEIDQECGWMYETWHPDCEHPDKMKGKINYTVWSELFACPHCGHEVVYFEAAVDKDTFRVNKDFNCPNCEVALDKKSLERIWESYFDETLGRNRQRVRFVPVLINYQFGNHRLEKKADKFDLDLLEKIRAIAVSDWFPVHEMPDGERKGKDGYHLKGITHLHDFYFRRPLAMYVHLWQKVKPDRKDQVAAFLRFFVQGNCLGFTMMNRYSANHFSQVNRYFSGTLFVGSLISEVSPTYAMTNKLGRLTKLQLPGKTGAVAITCQSTTSLPQLVDSSVDYVFVDPPFGNNLHYSELNFFWEAWLRVLTQREPEAVMDKGRNRTLPDYQELMVQAFTEIYRVLKPGRWMTVEFHNSQNRVWNAIQEAILRAGFMIADVSTLDKMQETYKQSIQNLVKADLVISAYKPTSKFEQRFLQESGTLEGVWNFVRQHLGKLPVVVEQDGVLKAINERQDYLLYDRMIAFHIQRGISVPISAPEFYEGLRQRFEKRKGMFFLADQVPAYDRASLTAKQIGQLSLFVNDENSARQWLRKELDPEVGGASQTRKEIQPKFLKVLHQAPHEILPELDDLLEESFLQDDDDYWYVPDPNQAKDLEKLRQKALLREFRQYVEGRGRLRHFRSEAVRAGFAAAYQDKDYQTIIQVGDRLPEQVLHEDLNLLMYYDNARLRME